MTDEVMNLRSLVEKALDAYLLREMIAFAAERELEVDARTGAPHGEKNPNRLVQRKRLGRAPGSGVAGGSKTARERAPCIAP
jgi:hypothetical protein